MIYRGHEVRESGRDQWTVSHGTTQVDGRHISQSFTTKDAAVTSVDLCIEDPRVRDGGNMYGCRDGEMQKLVETKHATTPKIPPSDSNPILQP